MEIVRCSKGHFYDSEENSTCPVCARENGGTNRMMENIIATDAFVSGAPTHPGNGPKPTEPADYDSGKVQKYAPTVGVGYAGRKETVPTSAIPTMPKTAPIPMAGSDKNEETAGFNPVVGWLVCISGPSKGVSYTIHSQYNFIGRSPWMDISIPEDPHISVEKAAVIAYDDAERIFYFGPGSGHNGVRVNGQMIINSTMIKAYDTLTVGMTKLLFVPLCGDRFDWNETE